MPKRNPAAENVQIKNLFFPKTIATMFEFLFEHFTQK